METFEGANVFLCRELVSEKIFDALYDTLRSNGANVFLRYDPSSNSPHDFHVVCDPTHEKFQELKAKGCNLIGPHCVFFCAKECRTLPKPGYICCLAMEGVKILASDFGKSDRVWIKQIVTAMGGLLVDEASRDVDFVIVKNVLAAKYKWALYVLKKPIVSLSWISQCWTEHHLVPHECHRILPFTGLKICVGGLPLDERTKTEQLIIQNGGLSGDVLTKRSTHLVCDSLESDKYRVAKLWGHIHIVTRQWVVSSVARKAYLEEVHFTVRGPSNSYCKNKSVLRELHSQEASGGTSQFIPLNATGDIEACPTQKVSSTLLDAATATSNNNEVPTVPNDKEAFMNCIVEDSEQEGDDGPLLNRLNMARPHRMVNVIRKGWARRQVLPSKTLTNVVVESPSETGNKSAVRELHSQDQSGVTSLSIPLNSIVDSEACPSQKTSCSFWNSATPIDNNNEVPSVFDDKEAFMHCIVEDSEEEDGGIYLSSCYISVVGFDKPESRKVVDMILKGGATSHVHLSTKLTHVVVGSPSENAREELRQLAACGVVKIVKTIWLEDCIQARKELPVSPKHSFSDLFSPDDPICFGRVPMDMENAANNKSSLPVRVEESASGKAGAKEASESKIQESNHSFLTAKSKQHPSSLPANIEHKTGHLLNANSKDFTSPNIFEGHSFCFSESFPEERRDDVVEWVTKGGGVIIDEIQNARFVIECHGLLSAQANVNQSNLISTHWIRSCLEVGHMQHIYSHILFKPLPCHVPLPGFEGIRFCITQHEGMEKQLLRNLCFVLGSKCTVKLTRRTTHLLCKIKCGAKYDAACKWGIQLVTTDWITKCIKKNMVVPSDQFQPKVVAAQEIEADLSITAHRPTQAEGLVSKKMQPQLLSGRQRPISALKRKIECLTSIGKRSLFLQDRSHNNSGKGPLFLQDRSHNNLGKGPLFLQDRSHNNSGKGLLFLQDRSHNKSGKGPLFLQDRSNDNLSSKHRMPEKMTQTSNAVPDDVAAIEDHLEQSNKIRDQKLPDTGGCNRNNLPADLVIDQDHAAPDTSFMISKHWLDRSENYIKPSIASGHNVPRTYADFSDMQETESQVVGYEEDLSGRQKLIKRES